MDPAKHRPESIINEKLRSLPYGSVVFSGQKIFQIIEELGLDWLINSDDDDDGNKILDEQFVLVLTLQSALIRHNDPQIEVVWDSITLLRDLNGESLDYGTSAEEIAKSQISNFMLHLYPHRQEKFENDRRKAPVPTMSFQCLNPGYGFKQLYSNKPHSILIASGTL